MAMRMIPITPSVSKNVAAGPRSFAQDGKQVELDLIGEETELDRNIVEELADPLMHMVRNSLDHGIGNAGRTRPRRQEIRRRA